VDIARTTCEFPSFALITAFITEIAAGADFKVVRIKNRLDEEFDASLSCGYRDVLISVLIGLPGGRFHVSEIQATLAGLLSVKRNGGHGGYNVDRAWGGDGRAATEHVGTCGGLSFFFGLFFIFRSLAHFQQAPLLCSLSPFVTCVTM